MKVPLFEFDPPKPMPPVQGPAPDDWEKMVDSMEDVVHRGNQGYRQNGTAWAHIGQNIPYRMAGKSGTAQVVEIRQGEEYEEDELDEYSRKHAWFIAFAPADDPVIALSVLVENGGGGSSVAAPVAREVLDAYLLPQLAATMSNQDFVRRLPVGSGLSAGERLTRIHLDPLLLLLLIAIVAFGLVVLYSALNRDWRCSANQVAATGDCLSGHAGCRPVPARFLSALGACALSARCADAGTGTGGRASRSKGRNAGWRFQA